MATHHGDAAPPPGVSISEALLTRQWSGEAVSIYYTVTSYGGSTGADRPPSPPVVVVRGLGMTIKDSEAWAARMAAGARRDVITLDNRGSGKSSMPAGDYTFDDMADDAAAVLRHHGAARYHVIGVSMGGVIAMKLAVRHPQFMASLTIGCSYARPLARLGIPQEYIDAATRDFKDLPLREREEHYRHIFEFSFTPGWIVGYPKRYARLLRSFANSEETRLRKARDGAKSQESALVAFAERGMEDELHRISCPCLAISGDADRIMPHENTLQLHRSVRASNLGIIPQAGHLFWETHPDTTDAMLFAFFERHDAARPRRVAAKL